MWTIADIYLNSNEKEEYQKWLNEEYENQKWMYDSRINPAHMYIGVLVMWVGVLMNVAT